MSEVEDKVTQTAQNETWTKKKKKRKKKENVERTSVSCMTTSEGLTHLTFPVICHCENRTFPSLENDLSGNAIISLLQRVPEKGERKIKIFILWKRMAGNLPHLMKTINHRPKTLNQCQAHTHKKENHITAVIDRPKLAVKISFLIIPTTYSMV